MGSNSKRVQQWLTFSRTWWLYDAKWQDPYKSAPIIAKYLKGGHKPIFGGKHVDCGDHVVVVNSKEIALRADEWFYRVYFHHTGYPGGATWTKAWELHKKDPTMIIYKAVYTALAKHYDRRPIIARLHIYPDEDVPEKIMTNVSDQIAGLRKVPKSIDDYSKEEIEKYPKLFDYPQNYVLK